MKVALISNYPIADNVEWKRELALKLKEQNIELTIVYGRRSFFAHVRSFFFRRKFSQALHLQSHGQNFSNIQKTNSVKKIHNNYLFFKKNKFKTFAFPDVNSDKAITKLKSLQCDYHITALDQILSKKFVKAIPNILNIHYGKLPDIKGTSSSEWTLFETGELYITLHYIDAGIDTGKIIQIKKIDVENADLNAIRKQIQNEIPNMYFNFLTEAKTFYKGNANNITGKLYTYMHREIKMILHNKLNEH